VKVLYLKEALPSGGAERQLALLMQHLPSDVERRLWTMGGGPFADVIRAAGQRVDVCARGARYDARPAAALMRLIVRWRPDVVHSWDWMSSTAALPVCLALGIPIVDGTIRNATRRRRRVLPRKACMALSSVVVANSVAGLGAWGVTTKGRVVYNGFDPQRLALCERPPRTPRPFTVVMAGRMVPQKDFRSVIAAARLLADDGGWRFVLAGRGPDEPALRRLAGPLVERGVVAFADPGLEVVPLLLQADAGVLLTDDELHAEGCSNAVMEYMACALPVVATDGGGNPELIVDGETGCLVPPGDAEALVSRLRRLAERPDEAAAMGAAGRRRLVERFTAERMVADIADVYREALAARRRGRVR
jgi:glycosyltransferase involved in cell wall biosynthesis